jgi:thioredoxin 1
MSDSKGALHLTQADFHAVLDQASKDKLPVFVDFYADWCGPCQVAAPIVDKLADEYQGKAIIAKLNVDENNQIAGEYGVMSIPTVIIFKDGEEVDRKIGFPGEDGYREMIDQA